MNTQLEGTGFPGALKRSIKPVGHISKVRTHTLYSLQMTMLGGSMSVNGSLAYVAQQAWILNDSLRENILFGKEYIEEKYELYLQMTHEISLTFSDVKLNYILCFLTTY